MKRYTEFAVVTGLLLASAGVFFTGLGWGMPSHDIDHYIFGSHPVWSGREILALAGSPLGDTERASDVSANPLNRDHPLVVNATDVQRARIVRRYRLMSYQPDEFATFAALARMNPSRLVLDPGMYKYGGLWVYPVGAMLKTAAATGLLQLKPDIDWYFDHPEAFGRFYVVARFYSALWGMVGVAGVFLLLKRICGSTPAAAVAGLCFLLMPAVINAAHEAKPHLAGAVLMLLGILAAGRYVEAGGRWFWLTAILCGMAASMVLTSLPVLLVVPAMEWSRYRKVGFAQVLRAASALLVAALVFFITNPYILLNFFGNRAVLRSHFGNTAGFYRNPWSVASIPHTLLLVGLGTSFVLAFTGFAGILAFALRAVARLCKSDPQRVEARPTNLLLTLVTAAVAFQFFTFATGQQADYARFALVLDIYLAIQAVLFLESFLQRRTLWTCFAVLVLATAWMGGVCARSFLRDCYPRTTRMEAAAQVEGLLHQGNHILATREEPAPWSMPPVDLWQWSVILTPRGPATMAPFEGADVTVGPVDLPPGIQPVPVKLVASSPFSWASKPFAVQVKVPR